MSVPGRPVPPGVPGLAEAPFGRPVAGWRRDAYTVIFEADTRAGRLFDLLLIAAILTSILVVLIDSVPSLSKEYDATLEVLEWFFTALFTVEYVARLWCVRRPLRYARSFFGVVDLVSFLPTYLAFAFPGLHALIDVRVLRLLRIFRIFKLTAYAAEYRTLVSAVAASRRKILVFLSFVLMVVLIAATLMYIIEGEANGFTSIPTAMYWAIVTMTTVGYGDIIPRTELGRALASFLMLVGWGILAVPTGIVTAEMTARRVGAREPTTRTCPECLTEGLDSDANYCKNCGTRLPEHARD